MADRERSNLLASFEEHYDELLRFLTRRIGDSQSAADVAQDTFLRLATAAEADAPIFNHRAYLFRVAGNLAIDTMRRERRIAGRQASEHAAQAVADPAGSPEAASIARERLALLDDALAGIPPRARRALLLSRVEGMKFADIAVELGVSESMIAKYIAQALRACRDRLRDIDDDGHADPAVGKPAPDRHRNGKT